MKKLEHYLQVEYAIRVESDPDGGFLASIPDLPGCYASGETKREAMERLDESKAAWLESYYAMHANAPVPADHASYSGRVLLRMPKYLHRKLHERARDEGVSVNQYLVALLAEGLFRGEVSRASHAALCLQGPSGRLSNRPLRTTQEPRGLQVGESSAKFRKDCGKPKPDHSAKPASRKS